MDVPVLADDHPLTALVSRPLVPAAVLVPLVYRDGWHIILTQRTDKLSNHAGQISFPGGRREEADVSYIDTALRESQEEIGLERDRVSLLGFLDAIPIITGFGVVPVVGAVQGTPSLQLDPGEVAAAFEVPLDFLLNLGNYRLETMHRAGRSARIHVIQYESWRIWGATAAMLHNLAVRVQTRGEQQ
ncbi:MAG: CoA pyrophosphatase [Pseudomonadota bacterium]